MFPHPAVKFVFELVGPFLLLPDEVTQCYVEGFLLVSGCLLGKLLGLV